MEFVKENVNPKNLNVGDCVIRAIAKASGESWDNVYKELCEIGFKKKRMPNNKIVYGYYLKKKGWKKCKMPRHCDNTRYTVAEFLDEYANDNDKMQNIIINVAKHLTCGAIDYYGVGVLYDTWDCSQKCVGNYWIKE